MEEILIDDVVNKNHVNKEAAVVGCSSSTTTIPRATLPVVTEEGLPVLSMLYALPNNLNNNNNNLSNNIIDQHSQFQTVINDTNTPILQIVNKGQNLDQINSYNQQILLQSLNQVQQSEKRFLVRKSNVPGAEIMQLEAPQEAKSGGNSGVAFLGTILKPVEPVVLSGVTPVNTSQIKKSNLVIAPIVPQINQTPSVISNSLDQSSKPMTNFILSVNISQDGAGASLKPNLNIKPNFNLKFNNVGQLGPLTKNTMSVLRDSKTPLLSTSPPPLHPISNASISNSTSNTTDSIKITENPDSAVITPIPKTEDSNVPEKRKKTISNILRGSTDKKFKKQSIFKNTSRQSDMEVSNYSFSGSESEVEKDKKRDKESDDDITLIKIIPHEDKNNDKKQKDIEILDSTGKIIKNKKDNDSIEVNSVCKKSSDYESNKVSDWKDDASSTSGNTLKIYMNEFGLMEVVRGDDKKQNNSGNNCGRENVCLGKKTSEKKTPMASQSKKDNSESQSLPELRTCQGCGCHGTDSEFESPISCSSTCSMYIATIKQQKHRNEEKENKEMRVKKKRKKLLQDQQAKGQDNVKHHNSKTINLDHKLKDSEEKFDDLHDHIKTEQDDDDMIESNTEMDGDNQEDIESKLWQKGKLGFSWNKYLEHSKAKAAPAKLFKDPFPYNKNNFKVGMKLEGIDPHHPSRYCVLSVAEVVGFRLRLHFDGYSESFDFWVNADSMDIFPVGWAEKNGHKLYPPKGYVQNNFNWNAYLKSTKAVAAPKTLFQNRSSMVPTGFRIGMKLEAVDRKHSSLVCVATVADVMDSRVLVHFDSWDDIYDYWADVSSPYIHPIGWSHHNGRSLTPPNYYDNVKSFSWDEYLRRTSSVAAPARAFKQRPPCGFKRGMKLEAVDKRLPQLIRVATVEDVKDHMLKIRFDGWPENHAYWVDDDSPDIHPVGWCSKTGHPLERPITHENITVKSECGTFGCKGIGHVKGPKFATHNSPSGCPYSPQNLNKIKTISDRLSPRHESLEYDEEFPLERKKSEKSDRTRYDRSEKKHSLINDKLDLELSQYFKQNNGESYEKSDKMDSSERLSNKSRHLNENLSDDEEVVRKRKKRKLHDETMVSSNHETSSISFSYGSKMSDKKLRQEIYSSVYDPGYNPSCSEPDIWTKQSSALNRIVAKINTDPRRWSNEELIKFIQTVPNCKDIGNVFRKNNIDGEAFLMLCQDDLIKHLGLKLGPALKLYNSIRLLREKIL